LLQSRSTIWNLADHPSLAHFTELLQVGLIEQIEERRI